MTVLGQWLLKIGLALAIIAGSCGATWFYADSVFSQKYASLKAADTQAAKDAQKEIDDKKRSDETVTKEVNDAANEQISTMAKYISDGLMQHDSGYQTIHMPTTCGASAGPSPKSDGSTNTAGYRQGSADGREVAIIAVELNDQLNIEIDALKSLQLWRSWVRQTR